MGTTTEESEPGFIRSELVRLDEVPLKMLRTLDGDELQRSLQVVVGQTASPRMAKGGSCSMLGFD
jgi:hypothetical protein